MKHFSFAIIIILSPLFHATAQSMKGFDIFLYESPSGFELKENKDKLFYNKTEGKNYCQLFLYPATTGQSDIEKDFETNWNFFARNASQGINNPETKEKDTANGWQVIFGEARGSYNRKPFVITLTTFTKGDITFYAATVFSNEKYLQASQDFITSIDPHIEKFVRKSNNVPANLPATTSTLGNNKTIMTKYNTNFDDGWHATAGADYVQVTKAGTEVRLHYTDWALDDARPNTVDAPEYYWGKYVTPYFNVANPQKWEGVQYPVIYFMEGSATEKKTGKACYVAIKIVYSGGAKPIVIIAPNQSVYQQQFPHPNDADRMLNYNKFAVTANDIVGKWSGSGGGGVDYHNAYDGRYITSHTLSTSDEFTFNSNGTYTSTYRSANINGGNAQFGGQDFKGTYSVTDWQVTATNRLGGKTTNFFAQLIAVKGGYLLRLIDSDYSPLTYTLFRAQ